MDYSKTLQNNAKKFEKLKKEINEIHQEIQNFNEDVYNYIKKKFGEEVNVNIFFFKSDPNNSPIIKASEVMYNFIYGNNKSYPYLCFYQKDNHNFYEVISYFKMNQAGYPIIARINQKEKIIENLSELQNFLNDLSQNFSFFSKIENLVETIKLQKKDDANKKDV